MVAPDRDAYEDCIAQLAAKLARVETVFGDGPYFNGEEFALIDAAYAPIFIRLDVFRDLLGISITDDLPKIHAWQRTLLALPEVQKGARTGTAGPVQAADDEPQFLRRDIARQLTEGTGLKSGHPGLEPGSI